MKRKSLAWSVQGVCTAKLCDTGSISALPVPFNEEITRIAAPDYIDDRLKSCSSPEETKRCIVELYVAEILPPETVTRLFKRYDLGRY